jgi:hypothetical protein
MSMDMNRYNHHDEFSDLLRNTSTLITAERAEL